LFGFYISSNQSKRSLIDKKAKVNKISISKNKKIKKLRKQSVNSINQKKQKHIYSKNRTIKVFQGKQRRHEFTKKQNHTLKTIY